MEFTRILRDECDGFGVATLDRREPAFTGR
jgi:hypothetical protein